MVLLKWVLEHLGEVPIGKRLHGVLQSLMAERDRRKYATLSTQTIARSVPVRTAYILTWGAYTGAVPLYADLCKDEWQMSLQGALTAERHAEGPRRRVWARAHTVRCRQEQVKRRRKRW